MSVQRKIVRIDPTSRAISLPEPHTQLLLDMKAGRITTLIDKVTLRLRAGKWKQDVDELPRGWQTSFPVRVEGKSGSKHMVLPFGKEEPKHPEIPLLIDIYHAGELKGKLEIATTRFQDGSLVSTA